MGRGDRAWVLGLWDAIGIIGSCSERSDIILGPPMVRELRGERGGRQVEKKLWWGMRPIASGVW